MKKEHTYLMLCMLFFCVCFSQNDTVYWNGKVRDKRSGLPVKNAFIHLKLSNGGMYEAVSNDSGYYELKLKTTFEKGELSIATDKNTQIVNHRTNGFPASKQNLVFDFPKDPHIRHDFFLRRSSPCFLNLPEFWFTENSTTMISYKDFYSEDSAMLPEQVIQFYTELLTENPEIVIELRGWCDYREKNKQVLSEKRARLVADKLIAKGIPAERLVATGIGARVNPVTDADLIPKTSEEKNLARQKNRCVRIRIINWDYLDSQAPKKAPVKGEADANSESIDD